jgi:hypothetical protein
MGNNDGSGDSYGSGDIDSGDGDSRNEDSNRDSGGGDSDSGKKNNNQLKAAVKKSNDDGGSRGVSGGSDGFDVCSGDNNGSGDSNGDGAVTEATMTAMVTVPAATATAVKKTTIN